MDLPSFAPYPPPNLRKDIVPEEWESCLHAWLLLAEGHLLLSPVAFSTKVSKDQSLIHFLESYVDSENGPPDYSDPQSQTHHRLKRLCYLLVHRCLLELKKKHELLLEWQFISSLGILYGKWSTLRILLQDLWRKGDLDKTFQKHKVTLIKSLENAAKDDALPDLDLTLARVAALLRVCPGYGESLMLGSDFIDALSTLYDHASTFLKKKFLVIAYRCFLALMDTLNPRFSMLLDHLYALNSSKQQNALLAAVCSGTPFVRKLRERIAGPDAVRAEKIIQQLSAFEGSSTLPPKSKQRQRASRGKGKEKDEYRHGAFDGGIHVHRMSLVTQIQDLFPDLGSAFIIKLLDEYEDNAEQVTAHLLDDSLHPHLKSLDRSENLPQPSTQPIYTNDLVPNLAPHPSPPLPPTRRNIHDNDAFDSLTISPSQIHRGLKFSSHTADTVLQDRSSAPNKAAILSALAAFDSDDDERDDTYDVEDVGGTVDAAIPGSDEMDADLRDRNEEALFRAWKMSAEAFGRDAGTRRGKARLALRSETGMTDEAIEGWGIMLGRDPRRLRRLEARFEVFGGQQRELGKTSYREGGGGSGTESDRGEWNSIGRARGDGGFRGRGRGGRGGGGGDVAGPGDEKETQVARQRKDANKGGRANHNRRNQRAKKMARAGFAA
ncbi:MAG: hypothetical protein L6R37_000261 [Teloschistes peruensis]|nr:MAG: hypothetical protein L6R37_000261 [Teloschistes peruensis]